MGIVEQYVLMNKVGGSMPWCEYKQAQEELQKQREIEAKEQERAVAEVTGSQDTLYAILHHSDVPVDVTAECENVDKCYRNYAVTDLATEIRAAFLLYKQDMDLKQKWDLYNSNNPMLTVVLVVDGKPFSQALSLEKFTNIQSMDVDFDLGKPTAASLSREVAKELKTDMYKQVDIAFRRGGYEAVRTVSR